MAATPTGRAGEPRIRVGATPVRGTAGGDNSGLRCNLSNAAATGTGRRRGLDVAVRRRGAGTKSLYHHGGWRIASQRMAQYGSRTHSSPYALPGTSREVHRPGRLDPGTLTRRGYTCYGIDADPAMIARARTGRPGRYEVRRMEEMSGLPLSYAERVFASPRWPADLITRSTIRRIPSLPSSRRSRSSACDHGPQ